MRAAESPADNARPTTSEGKVALALKLVKQATGSEVDAAERVALQAEARQLAIDAGDSALALELTDAIADAFKVDRWKQRYNTFAELARANKSSALVERGLDLVKRAIEDDRYPIAARLADETEKIAGHLGQQAAQREQARATAARAYHLARAAEEAESARARLKRQPSDPEANLVVGRFLCFDKEDWADGLPLLAKSSDEPLKLAAARDLMNPAAAQGQKALGDIWWGLIERADVPVGFQTGTRQRFDTVRGSAIRRRALYWYAKAAPGLSGVDNATVQKRLAQGTPHAATDTDIVAVANEGPFASRESDNRKLLSLRFGGTSQTERAVQAALYWLAIHQSRDGSWSLKQYVQQCRDTSCTGPADSESVSAATAMGLLPFLGVGLSHSRIDQYQRVISGGVNWLVSHQRPDGDLSANGAPQMYLHGLAAIALCEDYGLSHDRSIGIAAQKAIDFIAAAQNGTTGGWRYVPGQDGDTSVLGWQLMAIKSAQTAGLKVNAAVLDGAKKWLRSVSLSGREGGPRGLFSYQPGVHATPPMTAVGLLCNQYLGVGREDPVTASSVEYLMDNQPDARTTHNLYYWYFGTQAMHSLADKDWDAWNRRIRSILVNTQSREGCASGSWDPDKPQRDTRAGAGGRLMMTSLSAMTLEVYYRYLPVYLPDAQKETPPERAK